MGKRFNPPPNWPKPPPGWEPPPGWRPDPSWPQPPQGWKLWVWSAGQKAALWVSLGVVAMFGGCVALGSTVEPTEPLAAETSSASDPRPATTSPASPTESVTPTSEPTPAEREEPDRPRGIPDKAQKVEIRRIVDGDTLELAALAAGTALRATSEVDVRLLEIDTPETKHPSEPVQCYGKKATRALERLLPPGSRAWVQRDEDLRDRYDRYLLYVWNDDGTFVNLRMVQRGYARAALYEPNDRYWERISAAEQDARAAAKGLWGACDYFGAPAKQPKPPPPPDEPDPGGNCSTNYSGCVPPYPPDVDCSDLDGPIRVKGDDPHRLDREGDGLACES